MFFQKLFIFEICDFSMKKSYFFKKRVQSNIHDFFKKWQKIMKNRSFFRGPVYLEPKVRSWKNMSKSRCSILTSQVQVACPKVWKMGDTFENEVARRHPYQVTGVIGTFIFENFQKMIDFWHFLRFLAKMRVKFGRKSWNLTTFSWNPPVHRLQLKNDLKMSIFAKIT